MTQILAAPAATRTAAAGSVVGVFASARHDFSKQARQCILLREGLGVEGDAHLGRTVQHRWDVKRDPARPNLRQVHLIQVELLEELAGRGFAVRPGELGENVCSRGIDLLALPARTRLQLGRDAVVEVTGLRHPCILIEKFRTGLLAEMLLKRPDGEIVRKAGVMGVVVRGGEIRPDDPIAVALPDGPHEPLKPI